MELKTTSRGTLALPDGTKKENTTISETVITQLQEGLLDPAVFEIPVGFRRVAYIDTNPPVDWQTAWAGGWQRLKARVERLFN